MPLGDLTEISVEQRLLQRPGAEQVIGQRQYVPVPKNVVMLGDHLLKVGLGPGGPVMPQQRVEHGHEVALAGPERPGQERPPKDSHWNESATSPSAWSNAAARAGVTT